jgi:isopentenyldiphosphate isomerase
MQKLTYGIACGVMNRAGKILLLKRSPTKKLFPNKWFVVGAYPLKKDDDFDKFVHRELVAETGFDGRIIKRGEVLKMDVEGQIIDVHTFLVDRESEDVKLNDEHTEFEWVNPVDINDYDIVPGTFEMIDGLLKI